MEAEMDKENEKIRSKIKSLKKAHEKIKSYATSDPSVALCQSRKIAEIICHQIYSSEISPKKNNFNLSHLIQRLNKENKLPKLIIQDLDTIRRYGNIGCHHQGQEEEDVTTEYTQACLNSLSNVINWYTKKYNGKLKHNKKEKIKKTIVKQNYYFHNVVFFIWIIFFVNLEAEIPASPYKKRNTFTDPPEIEYPTSVKINKIPVNCRNFKNGSSDQIKCIMKLPFYDKNCGRYKDNIDKFKCIMKENKKPTKNSLTDCHNHKDDSKKYKCLLKK